MLDLEAELNRIALINQLIPLVNEILLCLENSCAAEVGSFYVIEKVSRKVTLTAVNGTIIEDETFFDRTDLEKSFVNDCIRERKAFYQNDASQNKNLETIIKLSNGRLKSVLIYPLLLPDCEIGAILLYNVSAQVEPVLQRVTTRLMGDIDKAIEMDLKDFRITRMQNLVEIIRHIGSTLDREQLLRMIITYARELLNVEACSLFLKDETAGDLVLQLASNIDSNVNQAVEQIRVPAGQGIIGYVVDSGEIVVVENADQDSRHYTNVDQKSGFETRSILAVPLFSHSVILGDQLGVINEHIIGGIEAINKIGGSFNEDDKHLLRTFANQAATFLEVARLYSESNEMFLDVISALTASIDAKDPYTIGHSQRVSTFSIEIAKELELQAEDSQQVKVGSLLHDVGKIGIPDAILRKKGRLDDTEYSQMKEHTTIGSKIMGQVRMLRPELPAMLQHHERLDGRGYPAGLSGEDISLYGKIVAVADVFDAMTSDRPYRKALSALEAIEYIRKEAGVQFDVECVEAFIRAYQKGRIKTQKEN